MITTKKQLEDRLDFLRSQMPQLVLTVAFMPNGKQYKSTVEKNQREIKRILKKLETMS